jgi:hypothetical protein
MTTSLNQRIAKLPEVLVNLIIPYTYNVLPAKLLREIINYKNQKNLLLEEAKSMYYYKYDRFHHAPHYTLILIGSLSFHFKNLEFEDQYEDEIWKSLSYRQCVDFMKNGKHDNWFTF